MQQNADRVAWHQYALIAQFMDNDFVTKAEALQADAKLFLLTPMQSRASRVKPPIIWSCLPFTKANKIQVLMKARVYALNVRHVNNRSQAMR